MKEAKKGARRVLQVKQGIVVPPVVLQALLPDVASVVKNAMTAGSSKQTQPSQPSAQPQDTRKPRNHNNILNSFPCNICGRRFPTRLTLNEHSLSHDYECGTCKIPFSSQRILLKHSCCICKACNKPSARGNHNSCRRVFTCKCGEEFTHTRDFKTHQKIHVEIFGHCPTCGRQFTNETDLVNHVTKMKFPCIYCGECFLNSDQLSEHNEPRPEPKYRCKICRETFEDSFAAASHSRSHGAPMRSYSRKPKDVNAQNRTNAKELVGSVVKKVNLYEIPIEFDNKMDGKGDVQNDGGRWFFKIEDEPCGKLDGDLEERVDGAELKLECVKVEFEDGEVRELNQKTLDIGSSKDHAGMKEVTFKNRGNKMDGKGDVQNEGGRCFFKIEDEPCGKLDGDLEERVEGAELKLECVKVEFEDEEMRELNQKTIDIGSSKDHADALRKKTTCKREPALTNPPCTVEPSLVNPEPAETTVESEESDTHPFFLPFGYKL